LLKRREAKPVKDKKVLLRTDKEPRKS